MKKCLICKKEFKPYNSQKYCSKKCSQEKINQYIKDYYTDNKNLILTRVKKYSREHKEEIKEYKNSHKIEASISWKEYYQTHKKEIKLNRQKRRNELSEYNRNKRTNNINFKILCNLRNRVWCAIKRGYKSFSTLDLLGCSVEFLKQYLEAQFKPGMSWQNYGQWHIDHIRPCISFDLSKESAQRKCFHYTNLQPLWAEDNCSKNKY